MYILAKAIPTGIPPPASIITPYKISAQIAQGIIMHYYALHNFSNSQFQRNSTSVHVQYGGFAVSCKSITISLANKIIKVSVIFVGFSMFEI